MAVLPSLAQRARAVRISRVTTGPGNVTGRRRAQRTRTSRRTAGQRSSGSAWAMRRVSRRMLRPTRPCPVPRAPNRHEIGGSPSSPNRCAWRRAAWCFPRIRGLASISIGRPSVASKPRRRVSPAQGVAPIPGSFLGKRRGRTVAAPSTTRIVWLRAPAHGTPHARTATIRRHAGIGIGLGRVEERPVPAIGEARQTDAARLGARCAGIR